MKYNERLTKIVTDTIKSDADKAKKTINKRVVEVNKGIQQQTDILNALKGDKELDPMTIYVAHCKIESFKRELQYYEDLTKELF